MAFTRDLSLLSQPFQLDQASINAVKKSLDALPKELRKAAERSVIRAGANIVLKEARARVPVKTGILKKSLSVTVNSFKGNISAKIGPKSGYRYPKNKTGRRHKSKKGRRIDAQEVAFYLETGTPNMPAQSFIRPALEASKGKILEAMTSGLDRHLTKVAAKLAKK